MPFFSNAQNVNLYGTTLTDVQGDFHNHSYVSTQQWDPLLQILYPETAKGAAYNSRERDPPPRCQPGTRKAILGEIKGWARTGAGGSGSIMWLHGPAGAGKTAIAQTICEASAGQAQLGASFFFSRGDAIRGKRDYFVTTLAFQLAMAGNEILKEQITEAVLQRPFVVHEPPTAQMERLVVRPLQTLLSNDDQSMNESSFLIVIDGIDECHGNDCQSQLLKDLLDLVRLYHLPLHILLVSRPEPHIKHAFEVAKVTGSKCRSLSLHGDHQAHKDVLLSLWKGFKKIRNAERHSDIMKIAQKPWPAASVITSIAKKSGGYFIYASTILKFVNEEYYSPIERLKQVVAEPSTSGAEAFAELDQLYTQVLSTSPKRDLLRRILGCIVLPLGDVCSESTIELQLGLEPGEVGLALRGLHSLLSFDKSQPGNTFISPIHASLGDFLLNRERAGMFFIDEQNHYRDVAVTCWRYFSCSANCVNPQSSFLRKSLLPSELHGDVKILMQSFQTSFNSITDKGHIIDNLKGANASTWAPLIHASKHWLVDEKVMLSKTVDSVIVGMEAVTPPPEELINELTLLIDSIYLNHLCPQSPGDLRLMQSIWTMGEIDRETQGFEQFLGVSQSPHSRDICRYLHPDWPLLSQRPTFVQFVNDPTRCGYLFADPETTHAHLAVCCIKELTSHRSKLHCTLTPFTGCTPYFKYSRENFVRHLSHAPSAVEQVKSYLQTLDLNVTFSELAQASEPSEVGQNIWVILTWLENYPEIPVDIVSPWRIFYETRFLRGETWPPFRRSIPRSLHYSQPSRIQRQRLGRSSSGLADRRKFQLTKDYHVRH